MRLPWSGLGRTTLFGEITAGITLLAISVPLNIGYAQIAGLPASAGLYALIVPTLIYAFLASSKHVVASPDAASAALVFSSLAGLGIAGDNLPVMAAAQALLSGLLFALAAIFRLGFLATFLSAPILIGFISGLALEILLSQIAKMLGIPLEHNAGFARGVLTLLGSLGQTHGWSLLIGGGCLAVLILGRRFAPRVPWALVVLVLAGAAVQVWGLAAHGVAVLGEVPAGPPVLEIPLVPWAAWLSLLPSAAALTLVTMAEGLLLSRSYAEKNGETVSPNRDLLAFGAANLAAGVSASFSVGSSTSRSAAMDQLGTRTQLPSLVLAAGTTVLLLCGTGLLAVIPAPAIGAVVAIAVFRLLGYTEFFRLWRRSRGEWVIALACVLGVLTLGPLGGLGVAFILSLIALARRAAAPPIDILLGSTDPTVSLLDGVGPGEQTAPGVRVLRFAAPIFFANGGLLASRLTEGLDGAVPPIHAVILDLEAVTDIDITGADALRGARDRLTRRGISFAYSRMRPGLRARLDELDLLAGTREFPTNREALHSVLRLPDTAPGPGTEKGPATSR
ncbi:SulP family inorganic anion transporter [Mycetocola spongiae]|uniref:SulP family inorganic anion transporter n=1 Tax=Mycetocola spongiae TaxID=2859226 RepID=UPI001CF560EB|nr:SulP family inorganic anion transporter [Mycetocola spongiae]UCR88625.1 SulP family inorganic anion transporter [Mycetocola spongiae]